MIVDSCKSRSQGHALMRVFLAHIKKSLLISQLTLFFLYQFLIQYTIYSSLYGNWQVGYFSILVCFWCVRQCLLPCYLWVLQWAFLCHWCVFSGLLFAIVGFQESLFCYWWVIHWALLCYWWVLQWSLLCYLCYWRFFHWALLYFLGVLRCFLIIYWRVLHSLNRLHKCLWPAITILRKSALNLNLML